MDPLLKLKAEIFLLTLLLLHLGHWTLVLSLETIFSKSSSHGALDFGFIVGDDFLEVLFALGTVVFKNRHSRSPLLKSISATEEKDWNNG
ncbi:MAG: hypothetical protein AMJ94_19755 [Deltaproteobacteria bacterium SM23_61]|nr:MAG: hypothetical protein AMJ94_19755 [Deltaproteobacteria bacterium SM23_61]